MYSLIVVICYGHNRCVRILARACACLPPNRVSVNPREQGASLSLGKQGASIALGHRA